MKSRSLKIEQDGDFWKGKVRPKIRLKGNWLERAGFKPGSRVSVRHLGFGVIELHSEEITRTNETFRQIGLPGFDV